MYKYVINVSNLQWAKKPIHKRSNFACESNCGSGNKDKSMGNCDNKGGYLVYCYAKVWNFSLCSQFNIYFTIWPLNESVFLLILGLASFGLYYCLYPPGHALQHIIINLLCHSIQSNHHLPPKHLHTSREDLGWSQLSPRHSYQCSIKLRSGDCTKHFNILMLSCWDYLKAFWEVIIGWSAGLKMRSAPPTPNCQAAILKNAGVQLRINSSIHIAYIIHILSGGTASMHLQFSLELGCSSDMLVPHGRPIPKPYYLTSTY